MENSDHDRYQPYYPKTIIYNNREVEFVYEDKNNSYPTYSDTGDNGNNKILIGRVLDGKEGTEIEEDAGDTGNSIQGA